MFLSSLNNSVQGQALQTPRTQQSQPQFLNPGQANSSSNSNQFNPGQMGQPAPNAQNPQNLQNSQNSQHPQNIMNGLNGMGMGGGSGMTPAADPTMALFSPLPNYQALSQNNDALLKSYENALGVGDDVDKLQESIDSLVRSMGLQPGDAPIAGGTGAENMGNMGADGMGDMGLDPDFNVDDFLEHLGKDDE
jgi:heat shock transcription factor